MELLNDIVRETWRMLCEMAPYLLFGFLVAGILSVLISPETVEKHLGGRGFWPVFKAALFGVPLPLCSCGVIPVAASLHRHGSSKGATTAFIVSTPQTGVDSILVTYALLGPIFAVFRPLAAFVSGILGGMLVDVFDKDEKLGPAAELCTDECCAPSGRSKLERVFRYGFLDLPRDIAKPLLIGLVVSGAIGALVPDDFFAKTLGTGILPMLVMMAVGIPIYVCATASVPIAAAMILKGVSPGAALVFLMTGPGTNAAAIATFWKVLGKRTTILYLLAVAVTALGSGLLLDHIFAAGRFSPKAAPHEMGPRIFEIGSAVLLLLLLAFAVAPRRRRGAETAHADAHETTTTFAVEGMTCSHCTDTVQRILMAIPGVHSADVDLDEGRATVAGTHYDLDRIKSAIEKAGFKLTVAATGNTPASRPECCDDGRKN